MKVPQLPDVGSPSHRLKQGQRSEVTLSKSVVTRYSPVPAYLNASTNTVISSVNGTLVIHVRPDAFNYNNANGDTTTTTNLDNVHNSSTPSYEQLSREFYQSYDPSIGLHTAAVLGGILFWLLLYLIYRSRVRKCIICVVKKLLVNKDDLEAKISDTEKDSGNGNNSSGVRNHVNPSIIIEASPSRSQPQSPTAYQQFHRVGQECLSPFSLSGGENEEGMIFQFPRPSQCGLPEDLCESHLQNCQDQASVLIELPKSETDIPSATAQWVQNMPLAAWSQEDFAGLMVSLQSHGLLSMQKPCSCPLVCPRTPQPLPLLEFPNSWNKSLPALSNSWSNQILSAYEAVINNHPRDTNVTDIINSNCKLNSNRNIHAPQGNKEEDTSLMWKNKNTESNKRLDHNSVNYQTKRNRKAKQDTKKLNITTKLPSSNESSNLINRFSNTRSPLPIPVTPTVMIQSSKDLQKHQRDRSSNASASSGSSADPHLASLRSPHKYMSRPNSPRIPSPHLLSPDYDSRRRCQSSRFSWSNGDIKQYLENNNSFRSRSVSPRICAIPHRQSSFNESKRQTSQILKPQVINNNKNMHRIVCDETSNTRQTQNIPSGYLSRCQSVNNNIDSSNLHINSLSPTWHSQRNVPTDVPFLYLEEDHTSPTNESNRSSLRFTPRPHNPSPRFLQVPELSHYFRPVTPDFDINKYYMDIPNNEYHSPIHHYIHSDGNIAYDSNQYYPVSPTVDNISIHGHSIFIPDEMNLSFCCDTSVRPMSSLIPPGANNSCKINSYLMYQHSTEKGHLSPHHCSTGMLNYDSQGAQQCGQYAHPNMNRSYSAVVMETKL